ncbi:CFEM domain-containing protein [Rutstroemia sp. NJR-2017a BBW]|nr:CFEM domain-containing protein [Rutstroemia sp. NJR-2017a BBW]
MSGTQNPAVSVQPTKVGISGVIWGGFAIAAFCMVLRTIARIRNFKRLYSDDIFAFIALACAFTNAVLWQVYGGAMFDLMDVSAQIKTPGPDFVSRSEGYSRASGMVIVLFYTTLWSVKGSFLLFIRRLGTNITRHRYLWWPVCCFTLATYFACIGTIQYGCLFVPLQTIQTKCVTNSAVRFQQTTLKLNCAWDVLTDFLIMTIPISMVWGTQMRLRRKITFGVIFSLALITVIFAIVRTTEVSSLTRMPDTSWLYMWSAIETTIAIIVVCLTSIRGLFLNQEPSSQPARYIPPSSSDKSTNKFKRALDSLLYGTTYSTYVRTGHDGEVESQRGTTSAENILPLESVMVKNRYEVTHEQA